MVLPRNLPEILTCTSWDSQRFDLGVSKNRGTPKWMVKIMENPIKMDDLAGNTPIFGNTHLETCTLW